jgi:hypothetical protein
MARHRTIAPKRVVSFGKVLKVRFTSKKKEVRASEVKKGVKRDPAWSWPCEQLKLP